MTILFVFAILWAKPIATTAEFSTPAACEAAKAAILDAIKGELTNQHAQVFCVRK